MSQKNDTAMQLQKILLQRDTLLAEVGDYAANFRKKLVNREHKLRTTQIAKTPSEQSAFSTKATTTQRNDSSGETNSRTNESGLELTEIIKSKDTELYHTVQNKVEKLKKNGQFHEANKILDAAIQQYRELIKRHEDDRVKVRNHLDRMKDNFSCPVAIFEDKVNQKSMYPKHLVYQNGNDIQLEEIRATHPITVRKKKSIKSFSCPIMIPEPPNPRQKIMYYKTEVYPGFGQDVQVEEIRARVQK